MQEIEDSYGFGGDGMTIIFRFMVSEVQILLYAAKLQQPHSLDDLFDLLSS